ncbi:MAG TPA: type 4a pilus biogenesis protein PilO [Gemmatimonadales bacterium]|nr:type 4a pilus biogenesis protein PilO [Gemmatimonadales bacterium]
MTDKERKQLMVLLLIVPIGAIAYFWFMIRGDRQQEIRDLRASVDSLQRSVDSAKRELASGTVEELRQRVADLEASVSVMRELVPADNEVAQLINDISDRAKLRNIHVADLSPLGSEDAGTYRVARYRFAVLGHYDDIGAFLSDIASLRRIMVPHQLVLGPASKQASDTMADTTGSLLQASFQLRTFVKQPTAGQPVIGEEGGAGGDR